MCGIAAVLSFVLEVEEVDRLREVGGRLLRQSAEYQELLEQIGSR
jgi:hypothetical protein